MWRPTTLNGPRPFKAPFNPQERIWQEADRLRAARRSGYALPVKVLDLAEFDLHLDLVPVTGLPEQLDMDGLLMGDLKSILVDSYSGTIRHYSFLTLFRPSFISDSFLTPFQ
jgi:hypothetical protein